MLNILNLSNNNLVGLRLRTLNLTRWIAILGQYIAVATAFFWLEINFNIYLASVCILISIILNIIVSIKFLPIRTLNSNETLFYLIFDSIQLVALLYITGGLTNPFCILIIAPFIISATYLDLFRTIIIGIVSILSLSLLAFFYQPISSNIFEFSSSDFSSFQIFSIWLSLIVSLAFIGIYCFRVANESRKVEKALNETQIALSDEEKISDMMSLTAAAVHELGTPLSTISVIIKEIVNELDASEKNYDDILLIQSQIKRCSEILNRLRQGDISNDNSSFINELDFPRLINEIVKDYELEEIKLNFEIDDYFKNSNFIILRKPEIVHSLSNIIENAYQYAKHSVTIKLILKDENVILEIINDGEGFPANILPILGEPYVKKNEKNHKGIGLGLFIAKNLINKTVGKIEFRNIENTGACVKIIWKKDNLMISH
ncbi:MAG: ActS/PrrB/RegB family redox-sensitive histidine kinase [Candidatus Pelagibacterales bacterium]|nr:ActS/PrrB/RegB family redox-sensitive histidine kinase [Pelagibacterales bacterium]MDB4220128.1 ActS/PrrB/RegB family redox-sensitive histidine kinase [Pelagibacterales bacterium]